MDATNTIAENRRARFDYEIKENLEAGIELAGFEVKGAKVGTLQIAGAHVLLRGGEAWLVNAHIPPYQQKNTPDDYDEGRARRLLLSRKEITQIAGMVKDKSIHIVPLRAYLKHGYIKIDLGIGRSRRKSDKREMLKKRAHNREMRAE